MLDPKHFVMTTPEVINGAPILMIDYSPDRAEHLGSMAGSGAGEYGGWTFLHVFDTVPEDADLYFLEQLGELDPAVQTVVGHAVPGIYRRESGFAPFEREEL